MVKINDSSLNGRENGMIKLIERYKKPLKIIAWIITFLWMGMIYYFSSQPAEVSLNSSGKVLVSMDKLEKEDIQNISDRRVWNLQNTIRKYAHFIVYSVLGFLMALSFVLIWKENYLIYLYSWLTASIYGVLDELHQHFVPGRGATLSDMGLDAISALVGTVFGLGLNLLWNSLLKKKNID